MRVEVNTSAMSSGLRLFHSEENCLQPSQAYMHADLTRPKGVDMVIA